METAGVLNALWPIAALLSAVGTVIGAILYSRRRGASDYAEILEKERVLLEKKLDDSERHRREMMWELEELKRENRNLRNGR